MKRYRGSGIPANPNWIRGEIGVYQVLLAVLRGWGGVGGEVGRGVMREVSLAQRGDDEYRITGTLHGMMSDACSARLNRIGSGNARISYRIALLEW